MTLFTNPVKYSNQLRAVTQAKYLGMLLHSKLNFNKHIDIICKKANSVLALFKINLYHCNSQLRSQAFILRPILAYASTEFGHHIPSAISMDRRVFSIVLLGL